VLLLQLAHEGVLDSVKKGECLPPGMRLLGQAEVANAILNHVAAVWKRHVTENQGATDCTKHNQSKHGTPEIKVA
jgi:hypothetical protein